MITPSEFDFSSLGNMGCLADDDIEAMTVPVPGSCSLKVEDKCMQLFTSAEWTLVASVGPCELSRSSTTRIAHSDLYTKRWARQLIRQNKARLVRLGVDVNATYVEHGGTLSDLDE